LACASAFSICWRSARRRARLARAGDAMGGTDPKVLEAFMDLINGWLSRR
jgi:hypothetical protein